MDNELLALRTALLDLLVGDIYSLDAVVRARHESLFAVGSSEELVLRRSAVQRVVEGMRARALAPADVQKWASFVKRGYVALGSQEPPLDIEYEDAWDEVISDVVSRLDEIGDVIDGVIEDDELDDMIRRLSR